MRALILVAMLGVPVRAQSLPGTADDPAESLGIVPSVVNTTLGPFAVRGSTPEDTVILVDGFEIPRLQHELGARSVLPLQMIGEGTLVTVPDVSIGRASSAVQLTTGARFRGFESEVNTFEAAARWHRHAIVGFRRSLFDPVTDIGYWDGQLRLELKASRRWSLFVSSIASSDDSSRDGVAADAVFSRTTVGATYATGKWRGSVAVSSLLAAEHFVRHLGQHYDADRVSLDTRAEIVRTASEAAGLHDVEWRLGEQTNMSRHHIDVAWPVLAREGSPQPEHVAPGDRSMRFAGTLWTPDIALWSSLGANLAPHVRATAGVRVDAFGRGGDVATQPRADLLVGVAKRTRVGLGAGAYRRVPQHADELFTDTLNPERTTQLLARVEHQVRALTVQTDAYYIDRTRLVIRDAFGVLRNTGRGTAYGIEVSARLNLRPWFVWFTGSLSRSLRRDFLRAAERPSQFDQPIRASAIVMWRRGRTVLGGRLQIASGLPTTSIAETVYDTDRDIYVPIFGRTYDDRLPFRYQVSLRADRGLRLGHTRLTAFLDVQLATGTIDYRYSFDFKERERVTLPIVPFVGLRGTL